MVEQVLGDVHHHRRHGYERYLRGRPHLIRVESRLGHRRRIGRPIERVKRLRFTFAMEIIAHAHHLRHGVVGVPRVRRGHRQRMEMLVSVPFGHVYRSASSVHVRVGVLALLARATLVVHRWHGMGVGHDRCGLVAAVLVFVFVADVQHRRGVRRAHVEFEYHQVAFRHGAQEQVKQQAKRKANARFFRWRYVR